MSASAAAPLLTLARDLQKRHQELVGIWPRAVAVVTRQALEEIIEAVLTARANLADVTDARFARASEDELAVLLAEGREARQRASETIASRTRHRD